MDCQPKTNRSINFAATPDLTNIVDGRLTRITQKCEIRVISAHPLGSS